jgi:hypothetical protein
MRWLNNSSPDIKIKIPKAISKPLLFLSPVVPVPAIFAPGAIPKNKLPRRKYKRDKWTWFNFRVFKDR